jgi:hypothetical protein
LKEREVDMFGWIGYGMILVSIAVMALAVPYLILVHPKSTKFRRAIEEWPYIFLLFIPIIIGLSLIVIFCDKTFFISVLGPPLMIPAAVIPALVLLLLPLKSTVYRAGPADAPKRVVLFRKGEESSFVEPGWHFRMPLRDEVHYIPHRMRANAINRLEATLADNSVFKTTVNFSFGLKKNQGPVLLKIAYDCAKQLPGKQFLIYIGSDTLRHLLGDDPALFTKAESALREKFANSLERHGMVLHDFKLRRQDTEVVTTHVRRFDQAEA